MVKLGKVSSKAVRGEEGRDEEGRDEEGRALGL